MKVVISSLFSMGLFFNNWERYSITKKHSALILWAADATRMFLLVHQFENSRRIGGRAGLRKTITTTTTITKPTDMCQYSAHILAVAHIVTASPRAHPHCRTGRSVCKGVDRDGIPRTVETEGSLS